MTRVTVAGVHSAVGLIGVLYKHYKLILALMVNSNRKFWYHF